MNEEKTWWRLPVKVTGLGWSVLTLGLLAAIAGLWLDWQEMRIVALACLFVMLLAVRYTVGKAEFEVEIFADPDRAERGKPSMVKVLLRNAGKHRLLPGVEVEIPVVIGGKVVAQQPDRLPMIAPGDAYPISFPAPTERRGVLMFGPVRTVRADPLGLLRREMSWTQPAELIVHPDTVVIGRLGAGLLRDLEGQATNDRSSSDVAFHSLREYVAGDDTRHIHAFTSARLRKPMVRQFVDTRTARLAVVVSGVIDEYRDEDEFECAISVGGSFAQRGVDDDQKVSVLAAGHHAPARTRQSRRLVLDSFSRAEFGTGLDLVAGCARMSRLAPDTSLAVLITGGLADRTVLRAAAARFGPDVRVIVVRVDSQAEKKVTRAKHLMILTVPELSQLRGFLQTRSRG